MYDGWLTVAGIEVVNRARTMAYRDALLPTLEMKDCSDCFDLIGAIGDEPYTTPTADEAPWYDPDTPASGEFLGFVASSMLGFEDSTRSASVTESNLDGGAVGRTRRTTREMRVAGALIGASQAACTAGLSWLKSVLDGNLCNNCDDSDDICFFAACPRAGESADDFIRHLRRVKCVDGPRVIREAQLSCGGYMVQVEFTLVAGSPFVYGEPIMVASAAGPDLTPIFPGTEVFTLTAPLGQCFAAYDKARSNQLLRDPDCPAIPNPPTVPVLTSACKPLSFNAFSYNYTRKVPLIKSGAYNARPLLATDGTNWVCAYTNAATGAGIHGDTVVKAKTMSTYGETPSWGSEYTLYNEADSNAGLETAALLYAAGPAKWLIGLTQWNLVATGFNRWDGVILTSTTGASGSWSVLTNDLEAKMIAKGVQWYRLVDITHHDNGSTNGILYALVMCVRTGQSRTVQMFLRSLDFGVTWTIVSQPWAESTTHLYTYGQVVVWPDGEIGLLSLGSSSTIFFKRSKDGGKTWEGTVTASTGSPGIYGAVITNDGGVRFFYRDTHTRGGGPRNLGIQNFKYSTNRGRTWSQGSNAFTGPNGNWNGNIGGDWAVAPNGDLGAVFAIDYTADNARVYWTRFLQIENFSTYAIAVPDSALRAWADGVMLLQIRTGAAATRQIRVRLIPRPIDTVAPEDLDPCSICSGFIIDYAPANTVIYLDGMTQRVTMSVSNGTPLPADHLVSGEDGAVFEWPTFSCGMGYFIVIDIDVATIADVALAIATRE